MSDDVTQQYLNYDPAPERVDPLDRLEMAALEFHRKNPQILREIVRLCLLVKSKGRKRWSTKGAFEVVRYNHEISTTGKPYKLCNSHTAYYARWIMRDIPELKDFFVTHRVAADTEES